MLRLSKYELFKKIANVCALLNKVERLNVVITDVETFKDADFERYSEELRMLSEEVEKQYVAGKVVQLNLLTDRMMLDKMNNCGAGDTSVALAPDGKFYVCPAFYITNEDDGMGALHTSIGDVKHGLDIKNPQLYKLDHAPLCRRCDAYQCKRCVWLNRKMTYEVNTPSHEQCVMAHLERNASRDLLNSIRKLGQFLPELEEIKEITYLDPFDVRKEW
nr:CXXX repeat peptide maturase [uncultured Prevotella sp.]